jgi:hypothetical protein
MEWGWYPSARSKRRGVGREMDLGGRERVLPVNKESVSVAGFYGLEIMS